MKTKSILLLTAICLLLSAHLPAQSQYTIHGIINDETGAPLIGASVLVKGTQNGLVTDYDGRFSLNVPDSCVTLLFFYTGYETKEMSRACIGQTIEVSMALSYMTVPDCGIFVKKSASRKAKRAEARANKQYLKQLH
ncbi:MAG: carboxypeptidase-like regulatory domain-containing protein [Saprospiraceae bacterium]|nr:carboxypeptidase-like regulatory domain-containing protein [Saprospiraceae bacterium]HRD81769.1 carboxypeptidase-like regulatory domain-containing protein [Saprospiraceae bacterium]